MNSVKKAFTLIELMVALGITSMLALVAFQFMDGLLSVWNETDTSIGRETEGRAALDYLARDLESAFFVNGDKVMFAVDVLDNEKNSGSWTNPLPTEKRPSLNSYTPANHRYGWAGCWLRFFTAAPSVNAVGYQIIRTPLMDSISEERYYLYRGVVRADYTAEVGFDIKATKYSDKTQTSVLSNPVEVVSPVKDNIISSDVVDFGVRLYVYDDTASTVAGVPLGMRMIFPASSTGVLDSTDKVHSGMNDWSTASNDLYPDAVEVFVRVLDREGADKLYEFEENGGSGVSWNEIVSEHGKLFSRLITIRGKGL